MENRKELFETYLAPYFSLPFIGKTTAITDTYLVSFQKCPQLIHSVKGSSLGRVLSSLVFWFSVR